ncbi:MAG TPA: zinc ribbon domain-containing protein [Pyrinomonadaceae bacterium]|jgi:hypothetical protein|nr:zinc ribbon domain-containing protein [Pyrinomonadaceae bacterium]
MFCPKCSQEQVSDETRFCSRCGFQLNVIKALLTNDDFPPNTEIQKPERRLLRKRDLTIGAAIMFLFALISAAITVDMPPSHSARIILLTVGWLVLTLLINIKPIFQYFVRGEISAGDRESLDSKFKTQTGLPNGFQNPALPTAHSIPADLMMPTAANTAEMVQPLSITEPTTNLLNK